MRRQQLQKLSTEDLEGYQKQLQGRNQRLKSMILVCEKEHNNLKRAVWELIQQYPHCFAEASTHSSHNTHWHSSTNPPGQKQSITQVVTQYALPVMGKVKEGTKSLGKNIVETSSWIGGSLLALGSNIKTKIFGESESKLYHNINPAYLIPATPPIPVSEVIEVPPIENSLIYQQIILSKQLQETSQYSKKCPNKILGEKTLQQTAKTKSQDSENLSKGDSKSIIDKLEGVISGEI